MRNTYTAIQKETLDTVEPQETSVYLPVDDTRYDVESPDETTMPEPSLPTVDRDLAVKTKRRSFVVISPAEESGRVFLPLQQWEGVVVHVDEDEFTAILTDKTHPGNPEEEVVLDRQEIPEDDQPLLQPGAVFYWSIGYEEEPGQPRRRVSQIRLRRLPKWTRRELEEAERKAMEFADLFR